MLAGGKLPLITVAALRGTCIRTSNFRMGAPFRGWSDFWRTSPYSGPQRSIWRGHVCKAACHLCPRVAPSRGVRKLAHSLLFVEDSSDDEALSLRAVASSGVPCAVQVIRDGVDAVKELGAHEGPVPDLIVLDFHLPRLNGLQILRELRKHERTKYVPVVMFSSLESERQVFSCLEEGANSCVKKPMDPKTYVENVVLLVRYWLTIHRRPENGSDLPKSLVTLS